MVIYDKHKQFIPPSQDDHLVIEIRFKVNVKSAWCSGKTNIMIFMVNTSLARHDNRSNGYIQSAVLPTMIFGVDKVSADILLITEINITFSGTCILR